MKCKAARILISAAADGEISKIEEIALDAHLADCVECRRERSSVDALRRRLTVWEAQEPAESLADSFSMRLLREHERRTSRRNVFVFPKLPAIGFATAAAAAILVLAFIGIAQRPEIEPQRQATEEKVAQSPVSGKGFPETTTTTGDNVSRLNSRNTDTETPVSERGFPETTTTESVTNAAGVEPKPAIGTTTTSGATRDVKRVRVGGTLREHMREAAVAKLMPRAAAAAEAVAMSKIEATRELVESAGRLRSLVAEANIKMESGLFSRTGETVDAAAEIEAAFEETPG